MQYRKTHGAFIVYSIENLESFEHCEDWLKTLREVSGYNSVIYLIGNKTDLSKERKVPYKIG